MGLHSFLDTLYNSRPVLALRQALRRKVDRTLDNKFTTFLQPLNAATADLGQQLDAAINALQGQLHNLNIDHERRHRELIPLLHRALEEHDRILLNQAYTMYPGLHAALLPSFLAALGQIHGGPPPAPVERAGHLLLLEIAKNYHDIPGGVWQLDAEINAFLSPAPIAAPTQASAPSAGPLRLLVISGMFPSIDHGGGLRLFDIISQLANLGHQIDLFAAYAPDLDHHSLDLLRAKLRQTRLVDLPDFTATSLRAWLDELGRSPGHYHAIQCEYPQSAKLIAAARPFGERIGFTFMECVTTSLLAKIDRTLAEGDFAALPPLARLFWEFAVAEQYGARHTDFQIAVTAEDGADIARRHGRQAEIIPTCLSPSQVIAPLMACQKDSQPEGNTVVFLGYFDHFPNSDGVKWYLRGVHQTVKAQVPDYRFLVLGAGDTRELRELSRHDPTVLYSGRVDDIMPHIRRGKVCVLPLVSGTGIRGKLNQYSIAGRPSVTTSIGNLGLNYPHGEAVFVADQPEDFAQAVITLLLDADRNRRMAERAREHAQTNFTWDRHIARLLAIYRGT